MKKFYVNVTRSGFSLIEVLVFVSILSIFFVSAAAVVTISLRNMKINEHKILATRYAEELMEWLKSQKEIDWQIIINKSGTTARTYCFNNSISAWPNPTPCLNITPAVSLLNSVYKRELVLHSDSAAPNTSRIDIGITVSWSELGKNYSVPINSIFSPWEQ